MFPQPRKHDGCENALFSWVQVKCEKEKKRFHIRHVCEVVETGTLCNDGK